MAAFTSFVAFVFYSSIFFLALVSLFLSKVVGFTFVVPAPVAVVPVAIFTLLAFGHAMASNPIVCAFVLAVRHMRAFHVGVRFVAQQHRVLLWFEHKNCVHVVRRSMFKAVALKRKGRTKAVAPKRSH